MTANSQTARRMYSHTHRSSCLRHNAFLLSRSSMACCSSCSSGRSGSGLCTAIVCMWKRITVSCKAVVKAESIARLALQRVHAGYHGHGFMQPATCSPVHNLPFRITAFGGGGGIAPASAARRLGTGGGGIAKPSWSEPGGAFAASESMGSDMLVHCENSAKLGLTIWTLNNSTALWPHPYHCAAQPGRIVY